MCVLFVSRYCRRSRTVHFPNKPDQLPFAGAFIVPANED